MAGASCAGIRSSVRKEESRSSPCHLVADPTALIGPVVGIVPGRACGSRPRAANPGRAAAAEDGGSPHFGLVWSRFASFPYTFALLRVSSRPAATLLFISPFFQMSPGSF